MAACFRDPNLKTGVDVLEEKKRLKDVRRSKKKSSQSFEIQSKMSAILINKSSLLHDSYVNFNLDDELFDDLNEIKGEVNFEEARNLNKVNLEQKPAKKEEPKRPIRKKTTSLVVYTNIAMDDD